MVLPDELALKFFSGFSWFDIGHHAGFDQALACWNRGQRHPGRRVIQKASHIGLQIDRYAGPDSQDGYGASELIATFNALSWPLTSVTRCIPGSSALGEAF